MFKNRIFVFSMVALLAFSFVLPVSAAPNPAPLQATLWEISGNAGVAGAVLTYNDPGVKTATADGSGIYSFFVSDNWTGTVTPSLSGYTFTPNSISYAIPVTADQPGQDYAAAAFTPTPTETETITATVTSTSTETLTATSTSAETQTPTITSTPTKTSTRTITVTPTKTSTRTITFTPSKTSTKTSTRTITFTPSKTFTKTSTRTITFTPSKTFTKTSTRTITPTPTITFTITRTPTTTLTKTSTKTLVATNTATVTATQTSTVTITPTPTTPSGFTKIYPWNGTTGISFALVTLSWTAYSTVPDKYRYCLDTINNDLCDDANGYTSLSKTARSITMSNLQPGTVYYWHIQAIFCSTCPTKTIKDTNSGAWWSFTTIPTATSTPTTTVTPTPTKTKTPTKTSTRTMTATRTVTPTPTLVYFTISGNAGVASALLSYDDKTVTANGAGSYFIKVIAGWTGTVTVTRTGYTFAPASRSYSNVLSNKPNENYWNNPVTYNISGKVGMSGVTLSFNDGAAQTVTSDANGNYNLRVKTGWTGSVTPSKPGVVFSPASITYNSLASNQTAKNYAVVSTLLSIAAQDGFVTESTETSGVGGTLNSTATSFKLGDDASNRQHRAILSFGTIPLPDNAVIQSAVLKIKQMGSPVGVNPFNILGNILVDIRSGPFGTLPLELADFSSLASATTVGIITNTPVSGWYSFALNSTGQSYISRTNATQFRLRFATDDNNNLTDDYMNFISGNATTDQPQLIITYTLP